MLGTGTARCLTVSEVNTYLTNLVDSDPLLNNIWVKGEISNLKFATSGHIYLTLKDEQSCLKCVIFRSAAQRIVFALQNGLQVMVRGYVSIYSRDGVYQLYVQEVQTLGIGNLYLAYEQLKTKLEQEGLFANNLKKPIPVLPSKIGIITSLAGAVLHDIITVVKRRFPAVELIIAPAAVQGDEAPLAIAAALENLNNYTNVDVIIIARGGGALEELWPFNTETVARAIFASTIPVISAIGHETDYTIADLVADRRAPTPSAAAEIAVPDYSELQEHLKQIYFALLKSINNIVDVSNLKLGYLLNSKALKDPLNTINQHYQFLDEKEQRMLGGINRILKDRTNNLLQLQGKLEALSPWGVLKRGFAICRDADGRIIIDAKQTAAGSVVEVKLHSGSLSCLVLKAERGVAGE